MLLAMVAGLAGWLILFPGQARFEWFGYEVQAHMAVVVVAALFAVACLLMVDRLFRRIFGLPSNWLYRRRAERRMDGMRAMLRGFAAVAAGDAPVARRQILQAKKKLSGPTSEDSLTPIRLLLEAQTARVEGKEGEAAEHYRAMLNHPDGEFLAIRGLLAGQFRDEKKESTESPLALAERAHALRPDSRWVADTLLELLLTHHRASDAVALVRDMQRRKMLDKQEARHLMAVSLQAGAMEAMERQEGATALELARAAMAADATSAPAALLAAKLWQDKGQNRKAFRLLQQAWRAQPQPELATAIRRAADIESPKKWLSRANKLAAMHPHHPESLLLQASAALEADALPQAREALENLARTHGLGMRGSRLRSQWLRQMESAGLIPDGLLRTEPEQLAPDATWCCDSCGQVSGVWSAVCRACHAVGAHRWKLPSSIMAPEPSFPQNARIAEALA
jgi:HemY protein